jgi:GntR family transcriptional regulator
VSNDFDPELTLRGGVSISDQIRMQIRDCVVSGQLLPGEQLPTVRAMAVELSVNPSAVRKAYEELECEGVLTSEEGSGTFVASEAPSRDGQTEWRTKFETACQEFLSQAARCGYSSRDVIETIRRLSVFNGDANAGPVHDVDHGRDRAGSRLPAGAHLSEE